MADAYTLSTRVANLGTLVPGVDAMEQLVSAGLTNIDADGKLRPQLAEAVPTVENGLWRTFPDGRMETTWKIRPNIEWHDGHAFSMADLLFTARIDADRDLPFPRAIAQESIDSVEASDGQTITVKWKRPYVQADALFGTILPAHLLEAQYLEDKANLAQLSYWSDDFVGTGPFKLKEWSRSSHMIVQANDRYVLGRPKVDEIEIRFIPDPSTLMANILAGQIDVTLGKTLGLEQAAQVRDQWSAGAMEVGFRSWIMMYPQFIGASPAAVSDVRFRRALLHALDRQQMVDALMFGIVPVAHSMLNPNHPAYATVQPGIASYPYDVRRATEIIDGAGYGRGADGMLRDTDDRPLTIEVRTTAGFDIQEKSLFAIAENWRQAGVTVETTLVPPQRSRTDAEYMATFPGFLLIQQPNDPMDLRRYHISSARLPENNYRECCYMRYSNPDYDRLVDRFFVTIPIADRNHVLAQIIQHQTDQAILAGLFYNVEPTMISKKLNNIAARKSQNGVQSWNAELWEAS